MLRRHISGAGAILPFVAYFLNRAFRVSLAIGEPFQFRPFALEEEFPIGSSALVI